MKIDAPERSGIDARIGTVSKTCRNSSIVGLAAEQTGSAIRVCTPVPHDAPKTRSVGLERFIAGSLPACKD